MNSKGKAIERYRNTLSNAQGNFFEGFIKAACVIYRTQGRAEIVKIPEPFRVIKKEADGIFQGRFTAHAQPDFQGTLDGGRAIVFEAKYTMKDRIKWNVLTEKQMEALEEHSQRGALAAVCVGIGNDNFFVPWPVWRDMKTNYGHLYATAADLEAFRVRFDGTVRFLDYVNEVGGRWINGTDCNVGRWRRKT